MFYAVNILSMQSKTNISLLYYFSTTNNVNKRIPKTEIRNLDIEETLHSLLNPTQPYALRLYSYLMTGIVKIYVCKIKYIEFEMNSLLSLLSFKKKVKRIVSGTNEIKRNLKKVFEKTINIETLDDFISSDVEFNIFENEALPEFMDCDMSNLIYQEPKKRFKSEKSDKVTEFIKHSDFISDNNLNVFNEKRSLFTWDIFNYQVFVSFKNISENLSPNIDYSNSVNNFELENADFSSVERVRNTSTISLKSTDEMSKTQLSFNTNEIHGCSFNLINSGSRIEKARNFYLLLEACSSGEVVVYQAFPFSEIIIYR